MNKEKTPAAEQAEQTEKSSSREQAAGLIKQLGVSAVYRTTDGYWFTKRELADQHAKANKAVVEEYKS